MRLSGEVSCSHADVMEILPRSRGAGSGDVTTRRLPPGPSEPYSPNEELLGWMSRQFKAFGNIYQASIYDTRAYVITDPVYAHHVLVRNWQNYVKGQVIKRVGFDRLVLSACHPLYSASHRWVVFARAMYEAPHGGQRIAIPTTA